MAKRVPSTKPDDIVVFSITRDSSCSECGTELAKGELLHLEREQPLCLTCADLDHLVFLASGDTALTRRSSKHSTLRAIVVRFSRQRKRYERQGILVEQPALDRAIEECSADDDDRKEARARAAVQRIKVDAAYIVTFGDRLGELYPGCPKDEQESIAQHACQKYSGRVGRCASAKDLDPNAIGLAVRAHVRHVHTAYDKLLARGTGRRESRSRVSDQVDQVLRTWQSGSPRA